MAGEWRSIEGPAGQLRVYASPAGRALTGARVAGREEVELVARAAATPSAEAGGAGAPAPSAAAPAPAAAWLRTVVVLCHELPRGAGSASGPARAYPSLADRLADECGCRVVAGMLRGVGDSEGDFSASGWLEDLACVCEEEAVAGGQLWLVGFGLGGAVALRAATQDRRVQGVVSVGAPADLASWSSNRDRVLGACRRSGVVRHDWFPRDPEAWAEELVALAPLDAAAQLGGRPLLVVHGSDDAEVPAAAARAIADAVRSGPVDLRLVPAAGHWLVADPRVVATLVGWIERHR